MTSPRPDKDAILLALRSVTDPASGQDVVSAGRIVGVVLDRDHAGFALVADPKDRGTAEALRLACETAAMTIPGITRVTAVLTADAPAPAAPSPIPRPAAQWNTHGIPGVKRVIAVASGKGGVGKSTTTVMLAFALRALGRSVAILDADIYGPSIPRMLGLSGQPALEEGKMIPLVKDGVQVMSMGFVASEDGVVWRAPMATRALAQMLRGSVWNARDILLVDLPPGTGDIALSLAQGVPLDGAVIVTTPQDVAVDDARKSVAMFRKIGVPILGVIENMSGFVDPSGTRHALFGAGGGAKLAAEAGAPLLAEIPLLPELGAALDAGRVPGATLARYENAARSLP